MHSYGSAQTEREIGVRDGSLGGYSLQLHYILLAGSMISKATRGGCAHLPAINV